MALVRSFCLDNDADILVTNIPEGISLQIRFGAMTPGLTFGPDVRH